MSGVQRLRKKKKKKKKKKKSNGNAHQEIRSVAHSPLCPSTHGRLRNSRVVFIVVIHQGLLGGGEVVAQGAFQARVQLESRHRGTSSWDLGDLACGQHVINGNFLLLVHFLAVIPRKVVTPFLFRELCTTVLSQTSDKTVVHIDSELVLGQRIILLEIFSTPNFSAGLMGHQCLLLWAVTTNWRRVVAPLLFFFVTLCNNLPDIVLLLYMIAESVRSCVLSGALRPRAKKAL